MTFVKVELSLSLRHMGRLDVRLLDTKWRCVVSFNFGHINPSSLTGIGIYCNKGQ
jgi:hypothetical protein